MSYDTATLAGPRVRPSTVRMPAMIGLLLAAAISIGVAWRSSFFVPSDPVEVRTLPPRVSALGRLTPKGDVISVAPPGTTSSISGARIEQLVVAVGDQVETGKLVAILDSHRTKAAAVLEANAKVEVARAKLAQVKAGPKPSELRTQHAVVLKYEAELVSAKEEAERANRLVVAKAISAEDLTSRKLKLDQAIANVAQAKAQLEALEEIRPEDISTAQAEVLQAEAALAFMEEELRSAEVRSPLCGQVLRVHCLPGERVSDLGIVDVGNTSEMQVVAEVYEEDVGRVRVGQSAMVRVPTLGADLSGTVIAKDLIVSRKVIFSNDPVADIDARVVEVRIQLRADESSRVAALSNARVEVIIDIGEIRQ